MITFEEYCNPEPRYAVEPVDCGGHPCWLVIDTFHGEDSEMFADKDRAIASCQSLEDNWNEEQGMRHYERLMEDGGGPTWQEQAVTWQRLK